MKALFLVFNLLSLSNNTLNMNNQQHAEPIPLIEIPPVGLNHGTCSKETSKALVHALQESGFLLIKSPLLSPEYQIKALEAARHFLRHTKSKLIVEHPEDPKVYAMLESKKDCKKASADLYEYMDIMEKVKVDVLMHLAVGLEMKDANFFTKLHDEHNDTLRVINYHKTCSETTANRCKEHSDYGSITLLSTDGVSGLEIFHNGNWIPVPYVKGALVVNIGTLLSGWTKGDLKATLHRVAGPASLHSQTPKETLIEACKHTRTSIAFFADPNHDVSSKLSSKEDEGLKDALGGMSVAEYIEWRSGGSSKFNDRSGIGFTSNERDMLDDLSRPCRGGNPTAAS